MLSGSRQGGKGCQPVLDFPSINNMFNLVLTGIVWGEAVSQRQGTDAVSINSPSCQIERKLCLSLWTAQQTILDEIDPCLKNINQFMYAYIMISSAAKRFPVLSTDQKHQTTAPLSNYTSNMKIGTRQTYTNHFNRKNTDFSTLLYFQGAIEFSPHPNLTLTAGEVISLVYEALKQTKASSLFYTFPNFNSVRSLFSSSGSFFEDSEAVSLIGWGGGY